MRRQGTSGREKKAQMHGDGEGLSLERRENLGKRSQEMAQVASMGGKGLWIGPSELSIKLHIQR